MRPPVLTVQPGDVLESESLWGEWYERADGKWPGEVGPIAIAGAATKLVVGLFIFVLGVYEFLVNGTRAYDWLVEHAPIPRACVHRLANAFSETGRGLFVGMGLTALLQGIAATIGARRSP